MSFTIDRSRYPYILRQSGKAICAVYDNASLDAIASLPETLESVHELNSRNHHLVSLFSKDILRPILNKFLDEDRSFDVVVEEVLEEIELLPNRPSASAWVRPEAEVSVPSVEYKIGQIWQTKRKGDLYQIDSVSETSLRLKWLGSYEYYRDVSPTALYRNYTYHSEALE